MTTNQKESPQAATSGQRVSVRHDGRVTSIHIVHPVSTTFARAGSRG